jgi:hypothetical protein
MGIVMNISTWREPVEGGTPREWREPDRPNGIGIEYEEAAEHAEMVIGARPVEIDSDEEASYDWLNALEEGIARGRTLLKTGSSYADAYVK